MELLIGAFVSLFIQYLKNSLKLSEYATLGAVLALSVVAAAVYSYLIAVGMWEPFLTVLTTAGAFYTYVIQRFVK